jgi:DNA-binding MarR family transcriptional regulator
MAGEAEVFERIFLLTRDFERTFRDQGDQSLSTTQFQALAILRDDAPITAMDMAMRLKIAGPTATRTLDSLERRELVLKERDPQDRRIVWLHLTETGVRAWEIERERQQEWVSHLIRDLSVEERQQFVDLLDKLIPGAAPSA